MGRIRLIAVFRVARPISMSVIFLLLALLHSQSIGVVHAEGYRSWIDVDVLSFDGQSITARIVLTSAGNHENATVRVYGEVYTSKDESNMPCSASICIVSSVTVSIGRAIREVLFSSETNTTTFQYTAKFASTYQTTAFFGLPNFPWDYHRLTLNITTDFKTDVDQHERTPTLPTANYEGFYRVAPQPTEGSEYKYRLDLEVRHPGSFQFQMLLWAWGVIVLLSLLTVFLLSWALHGKSRDAVATASSAVIVFLPVFELALQGFKAPLGVTVYDMVVFGIMVLDVITLVVAIVMHPQSSHERTEAAATQVEHGLPPKDGRTKPELVTGVTAIDSRTFHSPIITMRVKSSRPFPPALSKIEFDSYELRPIPTIRGEEAILEFRDEWVSGQLASHPVQEGKLVLSWLAVALRDRLSAEASEIDNAPSPPEKPQIQFLRPLDPPPDLQVLFDKLCALDDKLLRTYLRACDLYRLATQVIDDRPSLANFLLVSSIEVLGTIVTPGDSFTQSFLNFIKRYCPKDVLYANNPDLPADELLSKVELYRSQYAHGGKDVPVASSLAHALGLVWVRYFEEHKEELAPSISWFEHVVNASLMQFLRETVTGPPPARRRERLIKLALSFGTVHLKAKRSIAAGELLTPQDVELQ